MEQPLPPAQPTIDQLREETIRRGPVRKAAADLSVTPGGVFERDLTALMEAIHHYTEWKKERDNVNS